MAVRSALATDCQLLIRMPVEKLHMDKKMICKIITEDLSKQKLCKWFVLRVFTVEQREDRVTS